jgi:CRISPR-associated endonuclease/helicase Cas3
MSEHNLTSHGDNYFDKEFERIVGFPPAGHQRKSADALARGKSVLLRAPTGSGKSESVWIPFLLRRGQTLPMRMIHALPMRALVNQLESRFARYVGTLPREEREQIRVAAMHGARPESVLFYADGLFATLDQVVTSYACTPLSMSVRHGNIPAGAIPGSLLVFDEVHTFEPALGLQAVLVLAERAARMGMPFLIMSATLPGGFLDHIVSRVGPGNVEMIEGERLKVPERPERDVSLRVLNEPLTSSTVLERARAVSKTLVVVNTVARAQQLYGEIRDKMDCLVILGHSRFYDSDRKLKEDLIENFFGSGASGSRCVMIATQVVEVGLDISCDLLLTELAPIDAIVQRAGRCARWGGSGDVVVFTGISTSRPYDDDLVTTTRQALDRREERLTWDLEKKLVDEILDPHFAKWSDPKAAGNILISLAEAAFYGDARKAAKTVRNAVSVDVAIHNSPQSLGTRVMRLPRCRLHPGTLKTFLRHERPSIWQVVVDRGEAASQGDTADDYKARLRFAGVSTDSSAMLMPGAFYVIDPRFAAYDSDYGLRLGVAGESAQPTMAGRSKAPLKGQLQPETWSRHISEVVAAFEKYVLPKEENALEALARWIGKSREDLLSITRLVLIFHDLGKLTKAWQEKIKTDLENAGRPGYFLAHRGGGIRGLPPHATVSCWVATNCVCRVAGPEWEGWLAEPALAAIAHHHSVRADATPEFEMAGEWFDVVARSVRGLAGIEIQRTDFNTVPPSGSGSSGVGFDLLVPEAYTAYILLSRWLRLSDRIATAGTEETILDYERWMADF